MLPRDSLTPALLGFFCGFELKVRSAKNYPRHQNLREALFLLSSFPVCGIIVLPAPSIA
jgi:hypothetical protein